MSKYKKEELYIIFGSLKVYLKKFKYHSNN